MRTCTWSSRIKVKVDSHWSMQLQENWTVLKERRLQRFWNIEFSPSRPTTFGRPIISLDSRTSKLDRLRTGRRIVHTENHTYWTMTIQIDANDRLVKLNVINFPKDRPLSKQDLSFLACSRKRFDKSSKFPNGVL